MSSHLMGTEAHRHTRSTEPWAVTLQLFRVPHKRVLSSFRHFSPTARLQLILWNKWGREWNVPPYPLHTSSSCQVQPQRRLEATFSPEEANARRYMQYLSFPPWLCRANTRRRMSSPSYGLLLAYNLLRRNGSIQHPLELEARPIGALEQWDRKWWGSGKSRIKYKASSWGRDLLLFCATSD